MSRTPVLIVVRRTKEQAQETRDHILDMAEVEFHRRGVSRTTLEDIARAASVTRGAIYWHFEDKSALFHEMMKRVTLPLEQEIGLSGDPSMEDPIAQIRKSMVNALRLTVSDPQTRRVFEIASTKVEYVGELSGLQEQHQKKSRLHIDHMARGLARCVRSGALPAGMPARAAAIGLHSLVSGLFKDWMLDPTQFDLVRIGEQVLDLYIAGLRGWLPPAATKTGPAAVKPPPTRKRAAQASAESPLQMSERMKATRLPSVKPPARTARKSAVSKPATTRRP